MRKGLAKIARFDYRPTNYCRRMIALLTGCAGIPEGITVADGFDINRYLEIRYEAARLDFRFERGLETIFAMHAGRTMAVLMRGIRAGI